MAKGKRLSLWMQDVELQAGELRSRRRRLNGHELTVLPTGKITSIKEHRAGPLWLLILTGVGSLWTISWFMATLFSQALSDVGWIVTTILASGTALLALLYAMLTTVHVRISTSSDHVDLPGWFGRKEDVRSFRRLVQDRLDGQRVNAEPT